MAFNRVRKAGKFVFVDVPAGVFGWKLNKSLFGSIRHMAASSVNPACPMCDGGILFRSDDGVADKSADSGEDVQYAWTCQSAEGRKSAAQARRAGLPPGTGGCGYALLGAHSLGEVRAVATRIRGERAVAALSVMEREERAQIARRHMLGSRLFYAVATCTFLWAMKLLASHASLIVVVDWLAFSFMFSVLGLKRAYRCWQVGEGHLFEAGAFARWFREGKWLV
jgi:hypothetical protein